MAINPINWPTANINSQVDFSPLTKLGDILKEQQQQAEAERLIAGLFSQSQQQQQQAPYSRAMPPQTAPPQAPQANPALDAVRSAIRPVTPNERVAQGFNDMGGGPVTPNQRVAQGFSDMGGAPSVAQGMPIYDQSQLNPIDEASNRMPIYNQNQLNPIDVASNRMPIYDQNQLNPIDVASNGGAPIDRYAAATSSIESGSPQGNYRLVGPRTRTGDRAFGRYQVMGENIPTWTEKYFGQRLTPREFLLNPEAQEAVYRGKFGEYAQKYGPTGAAKAWFAGERGMNNPRAADILGTTVSSYADKFNRNLALPPEINEGRSRPAETEPSQAMSFDQVRDRAVQNLVSPDQSTRAAGISSEQLSALYRNPITRPIAMGFLQKQLDPGTYEFMAAGDSIIRYNKRDGSYTAIPTHQKPIAVPEKSRVYDPNTQTFIGGDSTANAAGELPPNMRWKDPNNKMQGVEPIPGGTGEKIDSEIAARVGLAKSFMGQLPQIRERLESGELGIENTTNHLQGIAGVGAPGELKRKMDAGAEALIRMLTGAGMGIQEAKENAEQYRVTAKDTKFAIKTKMDQLERHLTTIADVLGKGRGGSLLPPTPGASSGASSAGQPEVGKVYHGRPYLGGPLNDPKSWGPRVQ